MGLDVAEEEEMQMAIEASLFESQKARAGESRHRDHQNGTRKAAPREDGGGAAPKSTSRPSCMPNSATQEAKASRPPHHGGHSSGPAKAATAGLAGGAWVDNSDFRT